MPSSFDVTANVNLDPRSLNASAKKIELALGRITGQASEFQKSLDASTARVFAFGATTAVLNGVNQAFKKLVSTTIEVEKRLIEINSIFQANEKVFNQFRNSIFQVAKDTGQAFGTVAEGAAELARQGLSAEETAKRLKASLVLTRISGLDAEKSVKALTAAINGFASAGLSANQIVNKLVAVDTAFAVSAQDLAEAFSRAGSTAEDAGVSFDQLLGLVTAVEQKTARGGAVIGNAFKSIFTRLSRGDTIESLKELGVQIDATQNGIQKLSALSAALENISDPTVASQIKELAGGVFQINVVSAALKDLSSDTSIFAGAAKTASEATNEAFEKNADLNRSLAAQINALIAGLTSLAERVGSLTFGPLLENLLGLTTKFTEFLDKALDPEKGSAFVKGLFKTIGQFLGGPAVVIFTGAFVKIFALVAKFAKDGLMSVFAIGSETSKIRNIEAGIVGLLQKDNQLRQLITSSTASQAQKEQAIISAIKAENALLTQQAALMNSIASAARARGVASFNASTGQFKGKKGFASGFMQEEAAARGLGATGSVKAHFGQGTIGGRRFIMNNQEMEIPNFAGGRDSAVIPMYYRGNKHSSKTTGSAAGQSQNKDRKRTLFLEGKNYGMLVAKRGDYSGGQVSTGKISDRTRDAIAKSGISHSKTIKSIVLNGLNVSSIEDSTPSFKGQYAKTITKEFSGPLINFGSKMIGETFQNDEKRNITKQLRNQKSTKLFSSATEGGIFESAIRMGLAGMKAAQSFNQNASEMAPFDFEEKGSASDKFKERFNFPTNVHRADAKRTSSREAARSFIHKILQDGQAKTLANPRVTMAARGHVPKLARGSIPRYAKGKAPKGDGGMGEGGMFLALSSASMALNTMSASGDEAGGALSGLAETATKAVNALMTFQTLSFVTGGKLGGLVKKPFSTVGRGMRAGLAGKGAGALGAGKIGGLGGLGAKAGALGVTKLGAFKGAAAMGPIGAAIGVGFATYVIGSKIGNAIGDQIFQKGTAKAAKKMNIANIGGMNAERVNLKRQLAGVGGREGIDLFNKTFAGNEEEVNKAFKSYEAALRASAEKTEQGIPTEEARTQATADFNKRLKELGGITKDTIFQQTDFNRRQQFLNNKIAELTSRINRVKGSSQMRDIQNSAMISSSMKDRADIMGALKFSGPMSASVGAAINVTQRTSAASDALMQKRALQAQMLTEVDPKKREDLEKGIEEAGKNFANIVKESSINFANNINALQDQMKAAEQKRLQARTNEVGRDIGALQALAEGGIMTPKGQKDFQEQARKQREKFEKAQAQLEAKKPIFRGLGENEDQIKTRFQSLATSAAASALELIRSQGIEQLAKLRGVSLETQLASMGGDVAGLLETVRKSGFEAYGAEETQRSKDISEAVINADKEYESLSEALFRNTKALDAFAENFSTDEAEGIPQNVKKLAEGVQAAAKGFENIKNITEPFAKVSAMTVTAAETAQQVIGKTEASLKNMLTRVEALERESAELRSE